MTISFDNLKLKNSFDSTEYSQQHDCYKHNEIYVKMLFKNGTKAIKKQCLVCGFTSSNNFKLSLVESWDSLPEFSENLRESYYNKQSEKRKKEFLNKKEEWFVGYSEYLKSESWLTKRTLVLKRDGNLCQSCLTNKAVQVHHLTYKHVFNEPLFELISICKACHDLITKLDRDEI